MSSLTEFLLARIAEDEAVARAATPGPWGDPADVGYGDFGWHVDGCPAGETEDSEQGMADAEYLAYNHPARVLAECEAKRRIVEWHRYDLGSDPCDAHDGATFQTVDCGTLLALALPYADHPDWREEWRP